MLTDFHNYFTHRLSSKFAVITKDPHLKHVALLHYLMKYLCSKLVMLKK